MRYTPYNIKNQEFNREMRGYDREEVQTFLESISLEYAGMIDEIELLKKEIDQYKEEIKEYKNLEKSLQSTLVNAHESSSKAVESAKKQNALIIKEAEIKAAQIVEKAKKESSVLQDKILELKEEKNLLIAKLKAMVESQSKILNTVSNVFEAKQPKVSKEIKTDKSNLDIDDIVDKLL